MTELSLYVARTFVSLYLVSQMMIIDFDDRKTARVIKPVIQNLNEQLIYISLHLIATTH